MKEQVVVILPSKSHFFVILCLMWMKNDEEGGIIDREKRATINSLMANINFKYKKTSDLQNYQTKNLDKWRYVKVYTLQASLTKGIYVRIILRR